MATAFLKIDAVNESRNLLVYSTYHQHQHGTIPPRLSAILLHRIGITYPSTYVGLAHYDRKHSYNKENV